MNARAGKKSEKHSSALALAPSVIVPEGEPVIRAERRINQPRVKAERTQVRESHRESMRVTFEPYAALKTIIRNHVIGHVVEYAVSIYDGLSMKYFIPTDRLAELDKRIMELFEEYSDGLVITACSQPTEQSMPASLSEPAPLPSKHEALLNKIFAASEWYDTATICKFGGFSERNPSAQPNRWKRDGKVFALRRGKADVYPAYAFGDDFRPLPAMKDVLCVFKDKKSDLKIAAWFASVNSWLRDERPLDVISSNPDAVINAAKVEVAPIDHG